MTGTGQTHDHQFTEGVSFSLDPAQDAIIRTKVECYSSVFYGFMDSKGGTFFSRPNIQEKLRVPFVERVVQGIERGLDTHWEVSSIVFEVAMAISLCETFWKHFPKWDNPLDQEMVRGVVQWSDANIYNGIPGSRRDKIVKSSVNHTWGNIVRWSSIEVVSPREIWGKESDTDQTAAE